MSKNQTGFWVSLDKPHYLRAVRRLALGTAVCIVALGCGSRATESATDTKTNWLDGCEQDSECSQGLSCLCGVCTIECDDAAACSGVGGRAECRASEDVCSTGAVCLAPESPADTESDETQASDSEAPAAEGSEPPASSEPSDDAESSPAEDPSDDSSPGAATDEHEPSSEPTTVDPNEPGGVDAGTPSEPLCGHDADDYVALGDECKVVRFACMRGTEMFSNECGCGCAPSEADAGSDQCDIPERQYVRRDPDQCAATTFLCEDGASQFFDECGCGCETGGDTGATICGADNRAYASHDPMECQLVDLNCAGPGFSDECGCGCIIDAECNIEDRSYVAYTPEACAVTTFLCVQGKVGFSDECGCGCEPGDNVAPECTPPSDIDVSVDVLDLGLDSCFDQDAVEAAAGLIESEEELNALLVACGQEPADSGIDFSEQRLFAVVAVGRPGVAFEYAVDDDGAIEVGIAADAYCLDNIPPHGVVVVALDAGDEAVSAHVCESTSCGQ